MFTAVIKHQRDAVLVLASKVRSASKVSSASSSFNGNIDMVATIGAGADANALDNNGRLPLQVAIEAGYDDVSTCLFV